MNPNLPRSTMLVVLAGRLFVTIFALGALWANPLERAVFACAPLVVTWFVVEMAVNAWHFHEAEQARKERDSERKRQRAEEARLRYEAAQREAQDAAEESLFEVTLADDLDEARIPLKKLMKRGVGEKKPPAPVEEVGAPGTVSGMSAADLELALMALDAESSVLGLRRA